MNLPLSNVSRLVLLGSLVSAAAGCVSEDPTFDPTDVCMQMGEIYEYTPIQTFEASVPPLPPGGDGVYVFDDDDLADGDFENWQAGAAAYEELRKTYGAAMDVWESAAPGTPKTDLPADVVTTIETNVKPELVAICGNYDNPSLFPGQSSAYFGHTPGFSLHPLAADCKEKYSAGGDGVVATVPLNLQPQDQTMASCGSVARDPASGLHQPNTVALNFWGPISRDTFNVAGRSYQIPNDGHDYSGGSVAFLTPSNGWQAQLTSAPTSPERPWDFGAVIDASQWEGISFWARLATAEEAVMFDASGAPLADYGDIQSSQDLNGGNDPRQDGRSQLGVMIQTLDTAGLEDIPTIQNLAAPMDPNVEPIIIDPDTRCLDSNPIDYPITGEAPYRDQCWDGFRTMTDISTAWKFYRMPFAEMRQAGWGRVGESFRIDQIRSIGFLVSAKQPANVIVDEIAFYRERQ